MTDVVSPENDRNSMAETTVERSNLYGFLATVFRKEPSLEFLHNIRQVALLEALGDIGVVLRGDFLDREDEDLAEELAIEYTRLFSGPGKHIPPYEAAQREGALWGKVTGDVIAFIGNCGFECAEDYNGLPAHIAVELECMQEIADREADAWRAGEVTEARHLMAIEHDFMKKHLGRWPPEFCDKVADRAELAFYREMANLARSFIENDSEEITKRLRDGHDKIH